MKTQSTARRAVLAVAGAALAAATLVPVTASAQQYYNGGYYDPCQRDQTGRQVAGAIIGGLAGMALGNNVVNDQRIDRWGRRRDNDTGATIGALVGAGVGANIGRNSAACAPARRAQPQQRYYDYAPQYNYAPPPQAYNDYYYDRRQSQPYDYRYQDDRYYDDRYYDDRAYDSRGACRMVESRFRMPDGRTQTRMVQACPDSQGRYQIVD